MSDAAGLLVSVRGEARRMVPPDYALVAAMIASSRGSKVGAVRAVEKMVGDITYIPTWQGWLYLATVIDCHTKAVIGWAMDDNYKTPLIEKAIEAAARNYPLAEDAVFHSDRGSNYMSGTFAKTLRKHRLRQSAA